MSRRHPPPDGVEKKALLFVNKKKQKTSLILFPGRFNTARSGAKKFFGSFFQKRTS
jgi:hypothetical protein